MLHIQALDNQQLHLEACCGIDQVLCGKYGSSCHSADANHRFEAEAVALTARHCRIACWQVPMQLPHLAALSAVTASAWAHLARTLPASVADEVQSVPFLQAAGSAGSTHQDLTASALLAAAEHHLPALPQSQMQPVTDDDD